MGLGGQKHRNLVTVSLVATLLTLDTGVVLLKAARAHCAASSRQTERPTLKVVMH
jgi:hypothetical protein